MFFTSSDHIPTPNLLTNETKIVDRRTYSLMTFGQGLILLNTTPSIFDKSGSACLEVSSEEV